LKEKAVQCYL